MIQDRKHLCNPAAFTQWTFPDAVRHFLGWSHSAILCFPGLVVQLVH